MKKLCIVLASILLSLASTPRSIAHATESALAASPAILEAVVNPQTRTVQQVSVTNTTGFPLPVKGSVAAFLSTESVPTEKSNTFNASSWFTLEPSEFILQPHTTQTVQVTLLAPLGTEPGGHYATIYFTPLIPQEAVSPQSAMGLARIGILTFLIVPGDTIKQADVDALRIKPIHVFGPVPIATDIRNTGNVHFQWTAETTITNIWGKIVATLETQPSIVLPGTVKPIETIWSKRLAMGKFTATQIVTYGSEAYEKSIVTQSFWVIPWPLLLGGIVFLTFIYKLFIVNHRRLKLALRVLRGQTTET